MAEIPQKRLHAALLKLLEAWPLAVIAFDTGGRILHWNRAAEAILGWPAEEVLGRTRADLYGTNHHDYNQAFLRILSGETLTNQEKRHPTRSGRLIDVSWSATPLPDADGKAAGVLVLVEDISRRKQLESELLESERFSRDVVDALPQNIAILDEQGTIVAVNKAWREFAAANSPDPDLLCEGINYLAVCDHATGQDAQEAEAYSQGIRAVMNGSLIEFSLEYPCHAPERQHWYNGRVSRFPGKGPVRIVIAHENITELKLAEQAIQRLAQYDPLTGLPNRMLLLDRLGQSLITAKREDLRSALLFLDLDRFKLINDSLGHAAGDKLLKVVAERLRETVRKSDTVARLGGDEFVILLHSAPPTKGLTQITWKILQTLSRPVTIEEQEIFPSTSIGIALFPDDGKDADSLLRCADMAMYRAKESGRNTYHFFSPEMHRQVLQRISLEQGLVQALERQEFQLYYQEQTELHSGKIMMQSRKKLTRLEA
ncbi:putative bifunctional diguanylate cyclase/phosphodiesterase [Trichloromonas sp.]|uniref:putative bifunctional diguanylate cyclase/phosphodiesterase n=1 Tax=Trichloromonas sp. TaxID=3069249 RepID=UPI002A3DC431|nr:diguanylate cyclase [Trichloromonas sp.]